MKQNFSKNELKKQILSQNIFDDIILKAEKLDLIYLSFNATLNEKMILKLFTYHIDNININLLRNKYCPSQKIEEFFLLNDKIYNISIAHNKNISKIIYKRLKNLNDEDINISLSSH